MRKLAALLVVLALGGGGLLWRLHSESGSAVVASYQMKPPVVIAKKSASVCATNRLSQNIVVSITRRHVWACAGATSQFDSRVVTGMEQLPADLTPTGTYHIYAKQTDLHLRGSDSTGNWDDSVHYWMPFLTNQYGAYGFHDAIWRKDSDFGTIDPNSNQASHGCVELPLATAGRLFNWSQIGTTVTITR